ncbi:hypothetical protein RBWH47_01268 [Rhodopirellula baltica WH47]|uniref:Uncharacterized protein n=1 Tax=Rhodopirellula baltica WH47 TaxID=991778 RepID=F2AQP0_RHOBT|nr:hypothetical protein RBWH47_01268 [Rhodopirellula baltica WH47]
MSSDAIQAYAWVMPVRFSPQESSLESIAAETTDASFSNKILMRSDQ